MDINDPVAREFLVAVYHQTEGDVGKQVSMHEVGAALGIDRSATADLSQELIVEGLLDLRTLAGGVSLTGQGLEMLQKAGLVAAGSRKTFTLRKNSVLDDEERGKLLQLLTTIRAEMPRLTASWEDMEQIVIDQKTLEIQLLSPRPKTEILRAVLRSLADTLSVTGHSEAATVLRQVID